MMFDPCAATTRSFQWCYDTARRHAVEEGMSSIIYWNNAMATFGIVRPDVWYGRNGVSQLPEVKPLLLVAPDRSPTYPPKRMNA